MAAHPWEEWARQHGRTLTAADAPPAAQVASALGRVAWVFPCCGGRRRQMRPMYPVCPEHGQRAVFLEELDSGRRYK